MDVCRGAICEMAKLSLLELVEQTVSNKFVIKLDNFKTKYYVFPRTRDVLGLPKLPLNLCN